jgi:hypothetical protein
MTIYRMLDTGWAVRADEPIPAGALIDVYTGMVCAHRLLPHTDGRAQVWMENTRWAYRRDRTNQVCEPHATACLDVQSYTLSSRYTIDATEHGNLTRFVNHSVCTLNKGR